MNNSIAYKLVKAAARRVVWKFDRILSLLGYSLIILDVENVKSLSFSRRTRIEEIEFLLNKLRPVDNGWPLILVGESADGGYLIPDDLTDIGRCMSAGCDKNWTFEKSLYSTYGIKASILDSIEKRPPDLDEHHYYLDKWLGNKNSAHEITFDNWVNEYSSNRNLDLLLQMDIEGFEWQALGGLSLEALSRFRIMSIEFHGIQNLHNEKLFKNLYAPTINKILFSFDVVHIHPNNCCGLHQFGTLEFPTIFEITFHRKDRATNLAGFRDLPNALDIKNVPSNPEIFIKWTSQG